jgi:hypothetical protein
MTPETTPAIHLITGRRGKGKTTLAMHKARQKHKGVFVWDPGANFEVGSIVSHPVDFQEAIDRDVSPIVYQPEDIEQDFYVFAHGVFGTRNVSVVVDEASFLQSPHVLHQALDQLVRFGRRRKIDLFLTQHRMADCNGLLLELVTEFSFFSTKFPRSLERIAEYTTDEIAGRVAQLPDFHFLNYEVESGLWLVNSHPDSWHSSINADAKKPPRAIIPPENVRTYPAAELDQRRATVETGAAPGAGNLFS